MLGQDRTPGSRSGRETVAREHRKPRHEHGTRTHIVAATVRKSLLELIEAELRRRAPEIKFSTPSKEPDVLRLDGFGVIWVEQYKDGRFGLAIQDDRGINDWGAALGKRVPLDPNTAETIETAAMETLAFLLPPDQV